MFVPRALRLQGVHEVQRPSVVSRSPRPQLRGSQFTTKLVTPEYIAQLAAGIELIFTDYAHQEERQAEWLRARYRRVDGEEKFIHLSAILEHPYISSLKPQASQKLLQEALKTHSSVLLDTSADGYYIRRRPASYPPKFLPKHSFAEIDDDGIAFWDQRTIYVEPKLREMCSTPAKIAYWLKVHGQLRSKWLPVQAVHIRWNCCAFVVLSGNVMHGNIWSKWRALEKPHGWKIMTKVEYIKCTTEDAASCQHQNTRGMRRAVVNELNPGQTIRAVKQSLGKFIVPDYLEAMKKPGGRRTYKRKNVSKSGCGNENARPDHDYHGAQESTKACLLEEKTQSEEPNCKRRRP